MIDPVRAALILIDMQEGFIDTASPWCIAGAAYTLPACARALKAAREYKGKPTVIIGNSVKGKGVSFMEDDAGWHGKGPNDAECETAMNELRAALAELEAE